MIFDIFFALLMVVPVVLTAETSAVVKKELLSKGCYQKGVVCHGLPGGCVGSEEKPCEVLAKISTQADLVHVELSANANQSNLRLNFTNRWIAVGFSNSGKMPDSAVVHCFRDQNGTATAKLTNNIPTLHMNIGWATVKQDPLEVISAVGDESMLACVVNLHKNFTINGSLFDLTKQHNLIAATGPLVDGAIKRHDRKPEISALQHSF